MDGASFDLYRNTNGVAGLQTTAGGGTPADQIVGSCGPTAGGNPCSVGNLVFGTYWWYETVGPTGYVLPVGTRRAGPITIDAGNAGTTFDVTVISDPEIPAHIKVVKLDKDTQRPLDGAKFTLYADTNKNERVRRGRRPGRRRRARSPPAVELRLAERPLLGDVLRQGDRPSRTSTTSTARTVKKVVIERKDAGTTVSVTFEDPQIRRTIAVDKVWFINGVKYTGGIARDGFSAALTDRRDGPGRLGQPARRLPHGPDGHHHRGADRAGQLRPGGRPHHREER